MSKKLSIYNSQWHYIKIVTQTKKNIYLLAALSDSLSLLSSLWHLLCNFLPGRARGDVLPPCIHMLSRGYQIALLASCDEVLCPWQMLQICQAEEIPCQVLALWQPLLVDIQHFVQLPNIDFHNCFICGASPQWAEDGLKQNGRSRGKEWVSFHLTPLLNQGLLCQSVSQEIGALPLVLFGQILDDGSRFCYSWPGNDIFLSDLPMEMEYKNKKTS